MKRLTRYNPAIHHRRSIRLKGYDYSQAGLYFITICCQDRACLFGEIVEANGIGPKMILNEYGNIAYNEWIKTMELRPNVELGEFIIMPNHMHGIIKLNGDIRRGELHSPDNDISQLHSPDNDISQLHSPNNDISQLHSPNNDISQLHSPDNDISQSNSSDNQKGEFNSPNDKKGEFNSPQRGPSQTIGAIIRGYKSSVTKQLNSLNIGRKVWQRNYYEHIIRNDAAYQNISNYIIHNPAKWAEDKFYKI